MKLGELVVATERRLRAAKLHYGHGTENAHDEAAFLVLRGLGLEFDADASRSVSLPALRKIEKLTRLRIEKRIPVPYLLHEAWLGEHSFYVDERVIVPRSHIAPMLRGKLRPWLKRVPRTVLDLCTGSGCLAIVAAHEFPRAKVDASDVSTEALAVARRNISRHALGGRVRAVRSNLYEKLPGRYDVILSNPPYVTARAMRALPREYLHEPRLALAGGDDGLELVRRIVEEAPRHLNAGGILLCEIGDGRKAVERAFARLPLEWPLDEMFCYAPGKMG